MHLRTRSLIRLATDCHSQSPGMNEGAEISRNQRGAPSMPSGAIVSWTRRAPHRLCHIRGPLRTSDLVPLISNGDAVYVHGIRLDKLKIPARL